MPCRLVHVCSTLTLGRLTASGAVAGFLSGLIGSAGPLGAAAFLSPNRTALAYIATEATTAVAMHAEKISVYGHFIAFDAYAWKIAVLLSVGMTLGRWIGKKTVERISVESGFGSSSASYLSFSRSK